MRNLPITRYGLSVRVPMIYSKMKFHTYTCKNQTRRTSCVFFSFNLRVSTERVCVCCTSFPNIRDMNANRASVEPKIPSSAVKLCKWRMRIEHACKLQVHMHWNACVCVCVRDRECAICLNRVNKSTNKDMYIMAQGMRTGCFVMAYGTRFFANWHSLSGI